MMSNILDRYVLNDGNEIIFRRLEEQDVYAMYQLHLRTLDNLKKGQECFLHRKTFNDFMRMVNNPDMQFIGGFVGDRLACQSAVKYINHQNRDANLPDINLGVGSDRIALFEQVAVDDEFRGNKLGTKMVQMRENIARRDGKDCAVTMVDLKNYFSYRSHLRDGFNIMQAAIDPEDSGKIIYVYKDLHKNIEFGNAIEERLDAEKLTIEQVNNWGKLGYFVNGFEIDDKEKTQLTLAKTNYFINLNNMSEQRQVSANVNMLEVECVR